MIPTGEPPDTLIGGEQPDGLLEVNLATGTQYAVGTGEGIADTCRGIILTCIFVKRQIV